MIDLTSGTEWLRNAVIPNASGIWPHTLSIKYDLVTPGSGGGQVASGPAAAYSGIACDYGPAGDGDRHIGAETLRSDQKYIVTFPAATISGTRINIDPAIHRLVVDAKSGEPEKVFRVLAVRDNAGVIFEAVCVKEN